MDNHEITPDVIQEAASTIRRLGQCTSGEAIAELLMALADSARPIPLIKLQGVLDSENTRLVIRLLEAYLERTKSHEEWLALGELAQSEILPWEVFSWQTQ